MLILLVESKIRSWRISHGTYIDEDDNDDDDQKYPVRGVGYREDARGAAECC